MNEINENTYGASGNQGEKTLGPLLDALGWRGKEERLTQAIPFEAKEFSSKEVTDTLANLRYAPTISVSNDIEDIEKFPILGITEKDQFLIILKRLDRGRYLFFDSTIGNYKQSEIKENFIKLINFTYQDEHIDSIHEVKNKWFQKTSKRFTNIIIRTLLLSIVISFLSLVSPFFIMLVYNQISIANVQTNFSLLFLGIFVLIGFQSLISFFRDVSLNYLVSRMERILGSEFVRRTIYLPLDYSDQMTGAGHLARFRSFKNSSKIFGPQILTSLFDLPFTVVSILAIYYLAGNIAFIPVLSIALYAVFSYYYGPIQETLSEHAQKLEKDKNSLILDTITNLEHFKTKDIREKWFERFNHLQTYSNQEKHRSSIIGLRINLVSTLIVSITALITIYLSVTLVIDGEMNAGGLMAVVLLIWRTLAPIRSIFPLIGTIRSYSGLRETVNQFMETPTEDRPEDFFKHEKVIKGHFKFQKIGLRFTRDSLPSLNNVDLELPPLKTTLMVGKLGSGKSTILKLMIGLYRAQVGRITIDGTNIKQLNLHKLRKEVFLCSFDNDFLQVSLEENFKIGAFDSPMEEIKLFLNELKCIEHFNNLPDGFNTIYDPLDTVLFPNVFKVKLLLARAFASNTKVILFDEMFSELDQDELKDIVEILNAYHLKKTIIIAEQEPHLIACCDFFVYLEKGRVAYQGDGNEARKNFK